MPNQSNPTMKNGLLSHFFIITNTVCKSGFLKIYKYSKTAPEISTEAVCKIDYQNTSRRIKTLEVSLFIMCKSAS